ncbi:MAG: HAD family hydrolase [Eggerthellaceae bacterium]|nr:HAD family hydrolase [Eggerthellaceae bacterium]
MTHAAYIFDLDGTLLDTLPDLVKLTNMVLEQRGWPQRTQQEILSYVGDGGRVLLRRAAPADTPEEQLEEAFAQWQELYPTYGHALTKPYEGIPEALAQLKAQGAKLGVLSNKFDAAVKEVIAHHFPDTFDLARGECAEIPRKPDPRGLRHMIAQLGVSPDQVAYVGDSGTDMQVAVAAGAFPIGVSWGYRPVEELQAAGALQIISTPHALAN